MIALDTNLLVYAHRAHAPQHSRARAAVEQALEGGGGCGVAAHCLLEFWSVVTHPKAEGRPSTPAEAAAFLRALEETGGLQVWLPQPGFWPRLRQAAVDLGVKGPRLFDLQIALVAFDHGATEIWTHDADFLTLPGLKKRDPLSPSVRA
jgi:toxin-antitoxin system PIN domain toxin